MSDLFKYLKNHGYLLVDIAFRTMSNSVVKIEIIRNLQKMSKNCIWLLMLIALISCKQKKYSNNIKYLYSTERQQTSNDNEGNNVKLLDKSNLLIDSIGLRFLGGFSKTRVEIYFGQEFYDALTLNSDLSIAFAGSTRIPCSKLKSGDLNLRIKDNFYLIPYRQDYKYIDVYINGESIVVEYSNSILILSEFFFKVKIPQMSGSI
ncbi:hypothetical protein [Pinibacter aurantiacus]|uniref:Uncharacterized protein n=1 Tax=Pinibacter aurantiacus TaxID=2851599 RepID=A0A9E2SFF2_9BACT|nr:hypothetical protein [Pinibacter aurantiacus]MBV4360344.1 hypothetical protein [Pinibacter aurantiacus]